ncbi:MAG: VanZ family protein [Bacteroidota bacterium]
MAIFSSTRERSLWIYAALVLLGILLSLFWGNPLVQWLGPQDVQAGLFGGALLLVGILILVQGLRFRPGGYEIALWIGLLAVGMLVFVRLGLAERSHVLEYSVLALFIYRALEERWKAKPKWQAALLAWGLTIGIGCLDELIQKGLPNRVFDPEDILFNVLAASFALGGMLLLAWVRKRFSASS